MGTHAARAAPSDASPKHNLPVQLTSFIGRERELEDLTRLLGGTRLLTLTGTGGVGKTRLALRLADGVRSEYADGVWLIELAAVADPALVAKAVALALGVRERPGIAFNELLTGHLRTKQPLLVLDNCEHLVATCALLIESLLRACPQLRVLATSRQALGAAGEVAWRVPSLSLPWPQHPRTGESLARYEAARLFVERALEALPTFAVTEHNAADVARVCYRLDGIPLAIELAAARVTALGIGQIAQELDDRFRLLVGGSRSALPRQQTLRAALDWSYELLSASERTVLLRLAPFAGGFDLEAARAVCADAEVRDVLTHLVDKSLVAADVQETVARYRLLETVRAYAAEKLAAEEHEWTDTHRRHARFFANLVEQAAPALIGAEQLHWLERLTREHDNVRGALRWSIQRHEAAVGLRLGGALWRFWWMQGDIDEGVTWLVQALAVDGEASAAQRARALLGAGELTRVRGNYAQASAFLEEALGLLRREGDTHGVARCLHNLANVAFDCGNPVPACAWYEESLQLFRDLGDEWGTALALNNLGTALCELGEYARAAVLCQESLTIRRRRADAWGIAMSLHELATVAHMAGDQDRAATLGAEGLRMFWELKVKRHVAAALEVVGGVANARGDADLAAELFAAAHGLRSAIAAPLSTRERRHNERAVATTRAMLGDRRFALAWSRGSALTPDEAVAQALLHTDSPPRTDSGPLAMLTMREREVAVLLARGLSNRQIAAELVIATSTAALHVQHIREKLGFHSRAQFAAWAAKGLPDTRTP